MQMNSNGIITPDLNPEDIKGFRVVRSPVSNFLYNVYAVDAWGVLLAVVSTDNSFEEATELTQILNTPYDEVEVIQYETQEVQMPDGSSRYYQVQV